MSTPHARHHQRTPRPQARARRRAALAAVVAGALVVLALATWAAITSEPPGQPTPWRDDLAQALIVTGSIAIVAGAVWMLAIGTFTSGDIGYVRSASRARRAAATRAIRHGQMVTPEDMELTSALARSMAPPRAAAPIWLGILANTTGALLLGPGDQPLTLIAAGLILVGTAANIPTVIATARAQRWLDSAASSNSLSAAAPPATPHADTTMPPKL